MNTPTKIAGNGMVVATGLAPQQMGKPQNMQGGLLNAAAQKTMASTAAQAGHAKAAGVGIRGGGIHIPSVPEGGSIPGVSFAGNHKALIDLSNQAKANTTYDGLAGAQPYRIGGRKFKGKRIPNPREHVDESTVIGGKHRRKINGTRRRRRKSRSSLGKSRRRHRNSKRIHHTHKR